MDLTSHLAFFRILSFSTVLLSLACSKPAAKVEVSASKPAKVAEAKTATSAEKIRPTETSSIAALCEEGFDEALVVIERQDFPFRIGSGLAAIGSACPQLSDAIIRAAKNASAKNRAQRSAILYEAIKNRLSPHCLKTTPDQSAAKLGSKCYADRPDLSPRLIADMDVGTFAFFLVVEEELKAKNLLGPKAKRVLLNLLLANAMQGEKLKKRR